MIKYFARGFKITNENIILTTPLVLFGLLLSIYLGFAQNAVRNFLTLSLLLLTVLLMLSAFFSGWLFMAKKAVEFDKKEITDEEEKAKAAFNLIKDFPVGIGEYFLSFTGGLILYLGLFFLLLLISYYLGMHFIGKIGLGLNEIKLALESPVALKALVSSLTAEQAMKLNAWNFLFLFFMSTFSFITMYWGAEIIFRTKNPVLAFFRSLGFLFKTLVSSIILFVYISIIHFGVSLISTFAAINIFLYFVSMLVFFYFVVYIIVLIFLYYDEKITEQTQNNSDSGSDSLGQEQSGD